MNVILFKQIIQNAVVGEISEEMILCLIRAGMVLTNVQVGKLLLLQDSSDNIGTAMESSLKTTMTKAKKETRTTATKHPKKGSNEFGNVKKYTTSQSKLTKDFDATQLSVGKTKQIAIKHCTDSTNGKKQSFSDTIEISSDTAIDSNKTYDSQETISEEKTDTDFLENTVDAVALQHPPVLQQHKTKSVMSVIRKEKGKGKAIKASSDSEELSSPAILKSYSQFKTKKMKVMSEEITTPEHMFRNKMDLKLPGETQPVFKSVLETKTSETI